MLLKVGAPGHTHTQYSVCILKTAVLDLGFHYGSTPSFISLFLCVYILQVCFQDLVVGRVSSLILMLKLET